MGGTKPPVLNVPFRWPLSLLSKRFSSSSFGVGTWAVGRGGAVATAGTRTAGVERVFQIARVPVFKEIDVQFLRRRDMRVFAARLLTHFFGGGPVGEQIRTLSGPRRFITKGPEGELPHLPSLWKYKNRLK